MKVAFVCVHNSCRSQMAEAIAKKLYPDIAQWFSAGTEIKSEINKDAVNVIKELYDIDMSEAQKPKLLQDIPEVDIVITMGCNVHCPAVKCIYREDWGLEDPSGQVEQKFVNTAKLIEQKLAILADMIQHEKF